MSEKLQSIFLKQDHCHLEAKITGLTDMTGPVSLQVMTCNFENPRG
jgi:hypothetical protein